MKNVTKESTIRPKSESFFSFLTKEENKKELLAIIACYFVIYIAMRMAYGSPASTPDSGSYLLSAETGIISGYRPIGYSWMLGFFHKIFGTFVGIFTGQYLFSGITQILFLYTLKYFFNLDKKLFYIMSFFFILSPGCIYCTNYVMSDSVFNSFTLLYLVTGLWCIKKPGVVVIILHMFSLYMTINIRYAALFYPFLSFVALLIHAKEKKAYLFVSLIPLILLGVIYKNVKKETQKVYGISEFSGFGGWAMANNAVSIIPHIEDLDLNEIEDPEIRLIHQTVMSYEKKNYAPISINCLNFVWHKKHAGKNVLYYNMQTHNLGYVNAWIYTGQQMRKYGLFLIKKYPLEFTKYFLLDNFKRLFDHYDIPDLAKYEVNNDMKRYYGEEREKYEFENPFLHKFNPLVKWLSLVLWVVFFTSIVLLIVKKETRPKEEVMLLLFFILFFLGYLFISGVAHPVCTFRYLIPIYGIHLGIPAIVLSNLLKHRKEEKNTETTATA